MSSAGNYEFRAYTQYASDVNHANDSTSANTVHADSAAATISPSGSINICDGASVLLTASDGISWLWSNGATTRSVLASSAGSYTVTVTTATGCNASSMPVTITFQQPSASVTDLFIESMGSPASTTTIASYETANGFDNDQLTMSGSGDVRITTPSGGYSGATGSGNIFLNSGKNFIIGGINTAGLQGMQLSFGIYKSTTASSGSDFSISVSSDGISYTPLSLTALPTGSGTAVWHYRTATGTIPATATLYIQFANNSSLAQYRIDDVKLAASASAPQINSFNPVSGVTGTVVMLNGHHFSSTSKVEFNHINASFNVQSDSVMSAVVPQGASDGAITVFNTNCQSGSSSTPFDIEEGVILNLQLYIEGFYAGGSMASGDSITVELHEITFPYSVFESNVIYIDNSGTGSALFSAATSGNSYFIAIRHRNALETWSKTPLLLSGSVSYNFRQ
jgi:hypothetical protein